MGTPDFSRGGGFGTPEDKMRELEERHEEAVREIEADRAAKHAQKDGTPRLPWYKRLFRRSETLRTS
jgi:hypothetical protein